jgi:hypothetical protein
MQIHTDYCMINLFVIHKCIQVRVCMFGRAFYSRFFYECVGENVAFQIHVVPLQIKCALLIQCSLHAITLGFVARTIYNALSDIGLLGLVKNEY